MEFTDILHLVVIAMNVFRGWSVGNSVFELSFDVNDFIIEFMMEVVDASDIDCTYCPLSCLVLLLIFLFQVEVLKLEILTDVSIHSD